MPKCTNTIISYDSNDYSNIGLENKLVLVNQSLDKKNLLKNGTYLIAFYPLSLLIILEYRMSHSEICAKQTR